MTFITENRHCVFSTGSDNYIPKAIVSLLTFSKHNKGFDVYILCTHISEANKRLCESCGVKAIEVDLGDTFYQTWDYPKECFYHFKAPELFLKMGYEYSIYIDGDTYCNNKFDLDTSEFFHIAGSSYDTNKELFSEIGDYDKIRRCLEINDEDGFNKNRIQSGVIIYNNRALDAIDYFRKAGDLFDRCIKNGIPRKGDDSLLSLMVTMHPEIITKQLSVYFNLIDYKTQEMGEGFVEDDVIKNCAIYHFIAQKPWFSLTDYYSYPHKYFVQKWLEEMINNFTQEDIQRCFFDQYKDNIVEATKINFFWFSALPTNFGDWVTPYLIKKICGSEVKNPVDPTNTDNYVVLSTGSIMRLCGANTIVWGSGIRDRYQDIKPGKLIRSIRGPITRTRILEVGGECPPIYGDPALLLPRFYSPKGINRKYLLGIAPHISQYDKIKQLYRGEERVLVIDLRTKNIESVVDKLLMCEKIVSSSLHGIIVANAYNVPVRWIQFDTNVFGDNTKYYDHFESIGIKGETFIDALYYKKIPVVDLLDQIRPYEVNIDLDRLLDASIFHNGEISKYIRYELTDQKKKLLY